MSEATVRAAIYAIVNDVTNVGNVYDYERWATMVKSVNALAVKTIAGVDVIRFWTISCTGWAAVADDFYSTDGGLRRYTYKIRGAFGLDDSAASEKTAIGIVEDVIEALNASATLHNGGTFFHSVLAGLDVFELRMIGDRLCHYAEITQVVEEMQ